MQQIQLKIGLQNGNVVLCYGMFRPYIASFLGRVVFLLLVLETYA